MRNIPVYVIIDSSKQMQPYADNIDEFMHILFEDITPEICARFGYDADVGIYLSVLKLSMDEHEIDKPIFNWIIEKEKIEDLFEWESIGKDKFFGNSFISIAIEKVVETINRTSESDPNEVVPRIILLSNNIQSCEEKRFLKVMKQYTDKTNNKYSPEFAMSPRIVYCFDKNEDTKELLKCFGHIPRQYSEREISDFNCLCNADAESITTSLMNFFECLVFCSGRWSI